MSATPRNHAIVVAVENLRLSTSSEAVAPPHNASVYNEMADFPTISTYTLKQTHPFVCMPILLRPSASNNE